MRDFDRVRDKIEIRLEPRQVVMLAAGTMLFSGLLFAAGFMLGRSRAPSAAPTLELAAAVVAPASQGETTTRTARASAIGEVEFHFPTELGSRPARTRAERPAMRLSPDVIPVAAGEPRTDVPAPAAPVEPLLPIEPIAARIEPAPVPAAPVPAAPAPAARIEPIKPAPVAPAPPIAARAEPTPARAEPNPRATAPVDPPAPPIDEDDPDAGAPPAKPVAPPTAKPAAPAKENTGNRYTLQIKAARDKAEADVAMAELRRAGFKPHLVLADVPGKGRFYRVRIGRFASMAEARDFQRDFKARSGHPDSGFVTDL